MKQISAGNPMCDAESICPNSRNSSFNMEVQPMQHVLDFECSPLGNRLRRFTRWQYEQRREVVLLLIGFVDWTLPPTLAMFLTEAVLQWDICIYGRWNIEVVRKKDAPQCSSPKKKLPRMPWQHLSEHLWWRKILQRGSRERLPWCNKLLRVKLVQAESTTK